jgi:hypothetical protein
MRTLLPFLSPFQPSGRIWTLTKANCNGSFLRILSHRCVLIDQLILTFLILRVRDACSFSSVDWQISMGGRKCSWAGHSGSPRSLSAARSQTVSFLSELHHTNISHHMMRRQHHVEHITCASRNRRSCDRPRSGTCLFLNSVDEKELNLNIFFWDYQDWDLGVFLPSFSGPINSFRHFRSGGADR